MRFFKAIRYSAIGVFFTSIVTTLVGCSNEDQLRALLLFLLLLLTGGGGGETTNETDPVGIASPAVCNGGAVPCSIDRFSDAFNTTYDCGTGFNTGNVTGLQGVVNGEREAVADNAGGAGTTKFVIDATANTWRVSSNCTNNNGNSLRYLITSQVDLSAGSLFRIPVIAVNGTVDVTFEVRDATFGADTANFNVSAAGDLVIQFTDLTNIDFNQDIVEIIFNILIDNGESITFGPITVE